MSQSYTENNYCNATQLEDAFQKSLSNSRSLQTSQDSFQRYRPTTSRNESVSVMQRLRQALGFASQRSVGDRPELESSFHGSMENSGNINDHKSQLIAALGVQAQVGQPTHFINRSISFSYDSEHRSRTTMDDDQEAVRGDDIDRLAQKWDSTYEPSENSQESDASTSSSKRELAGIILMCLSALFQVVSSSLTQNVLSDEEGSIPPTFFDMLFFRNFPTLVIMVCLSYACDTKILQIPKQVVSLKERFVYLARLVMPCITFFLTCQALEHLQVSIYTVIFQTNPFIVSLCAYLFFSSKIGKSELLAMGACFVAIIFIAKSKSTPDATSSDEDDSGNIFLGMVFAALAAICFAIVSLLISRMQQVHFTVQLAHSAGLVCLLQALISLCQVISQGQVFWARLSAHQAGQMTLLGVSEALMFLTMTSAFSMGKPSSVSLFGYTNLLYACIADKVVFNRPVSADQLVPTLFIAFVTISIGIYQATKKKNVAEKSNTNKQLQTSLLLQDSIRKLSNVSKGDNDMTIHNRSRIYSLSRI